MVDSKRVFRGEERRRVEGILRSLVQTLKKLYTSNSIDVTIPSGKERKGKSYTYRTTKRAFIYDLDIHLDFNLGYQHLSRYRSTYHNNILHHYSNFNLKLPLAQSRILRFADTTLQNGLPRLQTSLGLRLSPAHAPVSTQQATPLRWRRRRRICIRAYVYGRRVVWWG